VQLRYEVDDRIVVRSRDGRVDLQPGQVVAHGGVVSPARDEEGVRVVAAVIPTIAFGW
jgi:hypothetical protein